MTFANENQFQPVERRWLLIAPRCHPQQVCIKSTPNHQAETALQLPCPTSNISERQHSAMNLSENRLPQNPLIYHYFPLQVIGDSRSQTRPPPLSWFASARDLRHCWRRAIATLCSTPLVVARAPCGCRCWVSKLGNPKPRTMSTSSLEQW